ncbi:dnaJ homolog subfamily C member 30, mitochondrial-like [Macrobrachium nipponense]|uniref:dnaJ homolog subfamily C member 30, mitochondrial-like n=1 Tax=Macrobrachium nipponense TaxID=159736 RepID=UPI0030C7B2B7
MTLLCLSYGTRGRKLKKSLGNVVWDMHIRRIWAVRKSLCDSKYSLLVGGTVCVQPLDKERFVRYYSKPPKTNYYDTLGITPKATHAQVKNAYYDLSKRYHPDQYKGNDGSLKFREITEAYEVLGNFQKRRMYDKGVFSIDTAATPEEAEEYSSKFYESRKNRGKMPSSGRTPIYNFDEWSKLHYESSLDRKQQAKIRYAEFIKTQAEIKEEKKSYAAVYIILILFWIFLFRVSLSNEVDVPELSKSRIKKEN